MVNVRAEAEKWLPYIVLVFPHYPQHGVEHSDRILAQLSLLLFKGNKCAVSFSSAEAYCLICAIYLHDIGMVVTRSRIDEIIASESWNAFKTPKGKGYESYSKYEALLNDPILNKTERGVFLANATLTQIIAEFVRERHHEFGKTVLEMHPFLRRVVDDGDSITFEAIAEIGVGHGLNSNELTDTNRFPEERLVLGEMVNVRFLARLLRIGDLLDVSAKRADPLSAVAAGPLPPTALPHWQQYSAKKHENISPRIVEFTFECKDQETHRVLRDWFGWLESEIRTTGLEQMHAARHKGWTAPICTVGSYSTSESIEIKSKPTIIIKPSRGAAYTFHEWKLQFDQEKVLNLLISDIYGDASVFVRELVQNALDATRCQMYQDYENENPGSVLPHDPTDFDSKFRNKYPIQVSLRKELICSKPDSTPQERFVFAIEDCGTGMDENIITRYFLQIGRSYYQSSEFREHFKFAPTSRFGVGFLSVFGVSEDITVETAKSGSAGIRLHLGSPKNYLLTGKWDPFPERVKRDQHGTKIRIVLNRQCEDLSVLGLIKSLCVQVEVPIRVIEGNQETILSYVPLRDGEILSRIQSKPTDHFVQRVFQIDANGVRGQLLLCAYSDENGEAWCDCAPKTLGLDGERIDKVPNLPPGYLALHGISADGGYRGNHTSTPLWATRIDVRAAGVTLPVSRVISRIGPRHLFERFFRGSPNSIQYLAQAEIASAAEKLVAAHLVNSKRAQGIAGCYYLGRVLSGAPVSENWRNQYPGTIITWRSGVRVDCSADELLSLPRFFVAYSTRVSRFPMQRTKEERVSMSSVLLPHPIISFRDTPTFVDKALVEKIGSMTLGSVTVIGNLWFLEYGEKNGAGGVERAYSDKAWWIVNLPDREEGVISPMYGSAGGASWALLNRTNPFVEWLLRLRKAVDEPKKRISDAAVRAAWKCITEQSYDFDDLLERWYCDKDIPKDLLPPTDPKDSKRPTRFIHTSCLTMEDATTFES